MDGSEVELIPTLSQKIQRFLKGDRSGSKAKTVGARLRTNHATTCNPALLFVSTARGFTRGRLSQLFTADPVKLKTRRGSCCRPSPERPPADMHVAGLSSVTFIQALSPKKPGFLSTTVRCRGQLPGSRYVRRTTLTKKKEVVPLKQHSALSIPSLGFAETEPLSGWENI